MALAGLLVAASWAPACAEDTNTPTPAGAAASMGDPDPAPSPGLPATDPTTPAAPNGVQPDGPLTEVPQPSTADPPATPSGNPSQEPATPEPTPAPNPSTPASPIDDPATPSTDPVTPPTDDQPTQPAVPADPASEVPIDIEPPADPTPACAISQDRLRITEVDLGMTVVENEDEAALKVLAVSAIPGGGSRLAFMGDDGQVHVASLDANDKLVGTPWGFEANDFADLLAHDDGGVLLLTRPKVCGSDTALCGTPPDPPIPCYGMYLVRFDESGNELWATELSEPTDGYSDGTVFVWWYGHHGRIAWSGEQYAAHFGSAISVIEGGCINIHQGDRQRHVSNDGALVDGGWGWGCSHTGYNRVVWNESQSRFASICKTDNNNRIMFNTRAEVRGVDLWYANLSNLVTSSAGYWLATSDIEPGQPESSDGHADVHLLRFNESEGAISDYEDILVAADPGLNERAPHLAAYGTNGLLLAYETSSATGELRRNDDERTLWVQTRSASDGSALGDPIAVEGVVGNRWLDFRAYPDGSVAFAASGGSTSVQLLRVLPCE